MLVLILASLLAAQPRCVDAKWPKLGDETVEYHGICCQSPDGTLRCFTGAVEPDPAPAPESKERDGGSPDSDPAGGTI